MASERNCSCGDCQQFREERREYRQSREVCACCDEKARESEVTGQRSERACSSSCVLDRLKAERGEMYGNPMERLDAHEAVHDCATLIKQKAMRLHGIAARSGADGWDVKRLAKAIDEAADIRNYALLVLEKLRPIESETGHEGDEAA